jgi:membrane protein YqaA with SNARE-associated domain
MTTFEHSVTRKTEKDWGTIALRLGAFLAAVVISVAIFVNWEQVSRLGIYGYPAVFLLSVLSSATLALPAPGFALVFTAGATLNPVAVGLVAGLGAAIGEMTGYMAGYSGQGVIQDRPIFQQVESWMQKSAPLAIFTLGAVPNPIFDVGGILAGVIRMPVWLFILAAWIGKSLRFSILAGLGFLAY